MKQVKYIGVIFLFLAMSCGTSRITSSWKAENVQPKKFNKILVLGLIRDADRSIREKMEQHLLGDLKEKGYNAICACEEYGPKSFENMSEKEAIDKLSNSGIDAVLTIVLLDKTKEKFYSPGRVYYSPYYNYHNRFWGYYNTMHDRIYSEGYYQVDTKYFWESNLYDMESKQLVYSVQTQSFDPSSSQSLAHEYGNLIVNDLVKSNVISSTPVLKSF
ncbi:MAG: hypothetical protein ABUL41_00800 [Chitinophagaceae bacterium]